jgi:hypothetical protein
MTLQEFELREGNHFVAMEYYRLIMNRTFLVLLTPEYLIGLKVNGWVSVESGIDPATLLITRAMSLRGDLSDPYAYIKGQYLEKLLHADLRGEAILAKDRANFRLSRTDIVEVQYDPRKKWGMGYYPHDGKVYVHTRDRRQREFIILANQSGSRVKEWILQK